MDVHPGEVEAVGPTVARAVPGGLVEAAGYPPIEAIVAPIVIAAGGCLRAT